MTGLETRLAGIEEQQKLTATANAKAKVADAVRLGKIPAQAADLVAKWENLLIANAANGELLDKLPVNPALATVVHAGATSGTATSGNTAEAFVAEVQVHAKAGKTKSQALDIAMAKSPDGYKAWRDANGKPAL